MFLWNLLSESVKSVGCSISIQNTSLPLATRPLPLQGGEGSVPLAGAPAGNYLKTEDVFIVLWECFCLFKCVLSEEAFDGLSSV